MDRREFLRQSRRTTVKAATEGASNYVEARAAHWIRPPNALLELEFLLACTRCGACEQACPYKLIFPLSPRLGAQVAGTPAMDLLNKGCHLCADWPCITACEPGALKPFDVQNKTSSPPLTLASVTIDEKHCLPYNGPECGACESSCPIPGALTWESTRPVINPNECVGCGLCREACVLETKAIKVRSIHTQTVM